MTTCARSSAVPACRGSPRCPSRGPAGTGAGPGDAAGVNPFDVAVGRANTGRPRRGQSWRPTARLRPWPGRSTGGRRSRLPDRGRGDRAARPGRSCPSRRRPSTWSSTPGRGRLPGRVDLAAATMPLNALTACAGAGPRPGWRPGQTLLVTGRGRSRRTATWSSWRRAARAPGGGGGRRRRRAELVRGLGAEWFVPGPPDLRIGGAVPGAAVAWTRSWSGGIGAGRARRCTGRRHVCLVDAWCGGHPAARHGRRVGVPSGRTRPSSPTWCAWSRRAGSRCASPARTRWRRPPTRTPASRQAACVDGSCWCREPPDTSAGRVSSSPAERRTT